MIKKNKLWEIVILAVLFLFSVSLFNLAGYIYAVAVIILMVMNIKRIRISICELLLIIFSFFFFLFYTFHYGINIQTIILYLIGPWTAYIMGKVYIERTKSENAFLSFITVLSAGMCFHGVLNWLAYIRSEHFETYKYYRRSVDFWHGELVNVNTTGMLYTFATGISIGIIFSNMARKYKIIAVGVLSVCIGASVFFANRTLLLIVIIIFLWKGLVWLFSKQVKTKTKIIAVLVVLILCIVVITSILLNIGGIGEGIYSLKIIQRFISDNESLRFDVWEYFIKDMNFIRYPFGGGYMLTDAPFSYFHNLWLDVYNKAGIIPFVVLLVFSCCMIKYFRKFRITMLKRNLQDEYVVFQCLIVAVLLNCIVEPIVEANPYYFLIVIMFFGAMIGKIHKEL